MSFDANIFSAFPSQSSFSSVPSLSCVLLFATTWTTASQASLFITSCLAPDNHWLIYGWIKDVIISLFIFLEFSINKITFSSFQFLSHVRLSVTPWSATHQASLYITNSQSLLKLMSIESAMPSNHLILCRPLVLPPSIFPSIRVFSDEI